MIDANSLNQCRAAAASIGKIALVNAERHYVAEGPWYRLLYWLGIPSTILSAIAGAIAFAKLPEWVPGSFAIGGAVLSGSTIFLEPSQKASAHHRAAKEYEALYREIGLFLRVGLSEQYFDATKAEEKLNALTGKLNSLSQTSRVLSGRSQRAAICLIEKGRGEVIPDDAFSQYEKS